jgi:hypothetical protein
MSNELAVARTLKTEFKRERERERDEIVKMLTKRWRNRHKKELQFCFYNTVLVTCSTMGRGCCST